MKKRSKIIFLLGLAGSGKDTVGKMLVDTYGYTRVSFADAVKDEVAEMENIDVKLLHEQGPVKESYREKMIAHAEGKRAIDPLCWLKRVFNPYMDKGLSGKGFFPDLKLVVTDCRRDAEIDWVHRWKASASENVQVELVIVKRSDINDVDMLTHYCIGVAEGMDRVERNFKMIDAYINNDGTLEDLKTKVASLKKYVENAET